MRKGQTAALGALVALSLVASVGCVGKKLYTRDMEQTKSRMDSMESAIESNQKRIGDMKSETDREIAAVKSQADQALQTGNRAMSTAQSANTTAQQAKLGRLLWDVKLSNDQVKFGFNQAKLPDSATRALDALINQIKGYGKAVYVEIEGHTDSTGSESYNQKLGQGRAEAVRDYMASKGVPLHAISTISYGETKPVADNGTREGREANRRVVVRVLE
jgi:peptidoglycan-associated lipoprotein